MLTKFHDAIWSYIWVSKLGHDAAIIWINADLFLIEPQGTNYTYGEILIKIQISIKKMHLKISPTKWPFVSASMS